MNLEKVFADVFLIPDHEVTDELVLKAIPSWDSMAHIMLITRIEDVWGIQLTGDEIADMKTVGDARSVIRSHGGLT